MVTLTTQQAAAVVAAIFIVVIVVGVVVYQANIPSTGRIVAAGVAFYSDSAATVPVTSITWGTVNIGGTYATNLYCKNTQDTNVTLTMKTGNWTPAVASGYLRATWNYTGAVLLVGGVIPIQFQLKVLTNATGVSNFSFNYYVNATQH